MSYAVHIDERSSKRNQVCW